MNFEKTTGYITIPDKYVVYTKLNEDGTQNLDLPNQSVQNEGQNMVWQLQDLVKQD